MQKNENVRQLTRDEIGSIDRLKCKETDISELKGKTLTAIYGLEKDSEFVAFYASDGSVYKMKHTRDCCESVEIDDVCGNVEDLIGSEIVVAEANSNSKEEGAQPKHKSDKSYTWTFYKLATMKGYVDIRWYGESNGYYSEAVEFYKLDIDINKEREKEVNAANKQAGYDIPLCFATLNTIVINTERKMGEIPLIEKRTAMAVIAEVIANAHGGVVTLDAVADIMQAAIAYGWHWAREGESMLRSESVRKEIMDYLRDRADKIPLTEYTKRKEGLERGFAELAKVVEKVEKGMRLQAQLKVKS